MVGKCPISSCGGAKPLTLAGDYPVEYHGRLGRQPETPHRWSIGHPNPEERTTMSFCLACHAELLERYLLLQLKAGNLNGAVEVPC